LIRDVAFGVQYWAMSADTVNAYYDSSMNSINFPAGIIQPPFFSAFAPPAVNFGGIGSVMGHEVCC
jgi:putative endopeptidase